jgi:hypothetical protein
MDKTQPVTSAELAVHIPAVMVAELAELAVTGLAPGMQAEVELAVTQVPAGVANTEPDITRRLQAEVGVEVLRIPEALLHLVLPAEEVA